MGTPKPKRKLKPMRKQRKPPNKLKQRQLPRRRLQSKAKADELQAKRDAELKAIADERDKLEAERVAAKGAAAREAELKAIADEAECAAAKEAAAQQAGNKAAAAEPLSAEASSPRSPKSTTSQPLSAEEEKLKANLEEQLARLLSQLKDVEEMKADLDEEEYTSVKDETLQGLREFEVSLGKLASGGLSTSTDLDRMRMALHAATGVMDVPGMKTASVIAMFAKNDTHELRRKLDALAPDDVHTRYEILSALSALKDPSMTTEEKEFLEATLGSFQAAGSIDRARSDSVLKAAANDISNSAI